MRAAPVLIVLILSAAALPARAGAARCWYENGAVVVSAALGNITGDFVLDLATPKSLLHLTRAQSEGIAADDFAAPLRLAGLKLGKPDFRIVDLDARNWGFPTEISGVIGADVLAGYVVDLTLKPVCQIAIWRQRAPTFGRAWRAPLRMADGVPTVAVKISDGATTLQGRLAIETGGLGVRLSPAIAALSRTPPKIDTASRTQPPARLRELTFAGADFLNLRSALDPDTPPDRLGDLGNTLWARYAIRIDLKRKVMEIKP